MLQHANLRILENRRQDARLDIGIQLLTEIWLRLKPHLMQSKTCMPRLSLLFLARLNNDKNGFPRTIYNWNRLPQDCSL